MRTGPHNALTDVAGLRVGHAQVPGALSGTTVVLTPPGGAVAGVDVRGAAPGTRETDLLDPRATVTHVHAIVLSGGSAFGLAAADGVMARLAAAGVGFPVPGAVVPIVPAAVLFDLGRGGRADDPALRPSAATGAAAVDAASGGPVGYGVVGAGTGAVAGGLKGGVGTASAVLDVGMPDRGAGSGAASDSGLPGPGRGSGAGSDGGLPAPGRGSGAGSDVGMSGPGCGAGARSDGGLPGPGRGPGVRIDVGLPGQGVGSGGGSDDGPSASAGSGVGTTVAALVVVNAAGSAVDPETGALLGARCGLPGEFALPLVTDAARAALRTVAEAVGAPRLGTATTLAVVATDATLDKAGCARLAAMGHDGLARALAPVHTALDGDTVFGLATGTRPAPDLAGLVALQAAAADVVSRAVVQAMLAAETVTTAAGTFRSYRDVVAGG